ncbi:unnamed protein product [Heligmosomoides polygyrus]|uniref:Uncharacterized protein n=1 Tax=Heligmosomoides polygyrus TaxID=6339 RepID=A0A3P7X3V5_HELPZ|nr:unnamed protein product [Heligmosomoides polygyrus]
MVPDFPRKLINGLFIFLVKTRTRQNIGAYKHLMVGFAICNILYASAEFISKPVRHARFTRCFLVPLFLSSIRDTSHHFHPFIPDFITRRRYYLFTVFDVASLVFYMGFIAANAGAKMTRKGIDGAPQAVHVDFVPCFDQIILH